MYLTFSLFDFINMSTVIVFMYELKKISVGKNLKTLKENIVILKFYTFYMHMN